MLTHERVPIGEGLNSWLEAHVPSYRGGGYLTRFAGGQSNPTFRLESDTGTFVLRRKPEGQLLASAHAIEREYQVLAALARTDVPVPRVFAMCEDSAIIGSAF